MMQTTPKGLRLQIGIFGRTNVGKSSFLNMISGQDVAIVSEVPGTTTDVVEKTMELLPIGPVVFLDTAGINDESILAGERIQKTMKIYDRADIAILVIEPNMWTDFEEKICHCAKEKKIPVIIVVNKSDLAVIDSGFMDDLKKYSTHILICSSIDSSKRNLYVNDFKHLLLDICPDDFIKPPALIGDLVSPGKIAVLIVPIDLEAPKGRLILPQVQTIRDALDNDAAVLVVKEREYLAVLKNLKQEPALVVCDSQVVQKMVADSPLSLKCTTFSILFARLKGDLNEMVRGVAKINELKSGDKVLIAESCSHHAVEDDIGRVKIPRWLRQYTGCHLNIDVCAGRDYPENLSEYKLIIHCGGCMLTRREVLSRMQKAKNTDIAITNYGVAISLLQGVLKRVLEPFPSALMELERSKRS